jgi:acyl-coenzyme A thioesterase PaaI-like protein
MDPATLQANGWTELNTSGFSEPFGPFWMRGTGEECEIGFTVGSRHTNTHMNTVHGGMLMTFADICLGYRVVLALGGRYCATAQLQLQFVSVAEIGEFVSCRPELIRRSSQLVFMRGLICADEKVVASADGIWKVLKQK